MKISRSSKRNRTKVTLPNVKVNFDILLFDIRNKNDDLYENISKSIKNVGNLPISFSKYIESCPKSIYYAERLFYTFFIASHDNKKKCPLCNEQLRNGYWKIKKVTVDRHTKILSVDLHPPTNSNYNDIKKSILSEMNKNLSLSLFESYGFDEMDYEMDYPSIVINNKKYYWIPYYKNFDIRLSKRNTRKKKRISKRNTRKKKRLSKKK